MLTLNSHEFDRKLKHNLMSFFAQYLVWRIWGNIPNVDERSDGEGLIDMVISCEKIRDLLRKLRADEAPGVDGSSLRLMLHFLDENIESVCILFEKSPRERWVHGDWRRPGGQMLCQFTRLMTGEGNEL